MDTECRAPTKAGRPCSAAHYRDGWCRWHHPDLESARRAERIAGGRAKSNRRRAKKQLADQVMSIADLDGVLCHTMARVLTGKLEPGVGTAAATLARTIIAVRQAGDLEQRLAQLEAAAGIAEGRGA
jgi:alcohol dehydrogenase class IV